MTAHKPLKIITAGCLLITGLLISHSVTSMSTALKLGIISEALNPSPPVTIITVPAPQTYPLIVVQGNELPGYFVSPYGNDNNSGTFRSPWKTLQASVNKLNPGDTLNILDGIYRENVTINTSGSSEQAIIIRAVNAFAVTIDGGSGYALDTAAASNLEFEGLKLKSGTGSSGQSALVNTTAQQPATCL